MGIPEHNIIVVRNGVDTRRFTPDWSANNDNVVRIISVGTLYWIKNQLMTIRAVSSIHDMGYNVELYYYAMERIGIRSKMKSEE